MRFAIWACWLIIAVMVVPDRGFAADWTTAGNAITEGTDFLGSTNDQYLEFRVYGTHALRLEPTTGTPQVIGGYSGNTASTYVGATICGGGAYLYVNSVTGNYGTVGGGRHNHAAASGTVGGGYNNYAETSATTAGGYQNDAEGSYSSVGGGYSNYASATYSTIGGGYNSTASGTAATVAGGDTNTATVSAATVGGGGSNDATGNYCTVAGGYHGDAGSSQFATVGGGYYNTATGTAATVPGGWGNDATADYSFAAGYRATADDQGCFMWADSQAADVACPGTDTFNVRAQGGIWLGWSSSPSVPAGKFIYTSTGGYLTTGGAWTDGSNPANKTDVKSVDALLVLSSLRDLSVNEWSYIADPPGIRHLGPMADEFHALFGLGEADGIAALDSAGVALVAIQALDSQIQAQTAQIDALMARLARVEAERRSGWARFAAFPTLLGGALIGAAVAMAALRRRRRSGP